MFLSIYPYSNFVICCYLFSDVISWVCCFAFSPSTVALLHCSLCSFCLHVLFLLPLFVVPLCPKVVVMPLTFIAQFSFFLLFTPCVFVILIDSKHFHLLIPVLFVTCRYGIHPTVFHELNVHSTFVRLILNSSNFL